MDQRLGDATRAGDIDAIYSLIKEDAYLLDRIDAVPFIDTPLHIAASAGHLCFSMEIMRLKPSYGRKSNDEGYTPIHLALLNGHLQLVLRFVNIERDLVRVQGREGKTPLHLAAECGMVDLIAEFLLVCPKSIQDLTIQKETALHVAVKNDKIEALKVLLGWLDHVGKDTILKSIDEEGNTILHIAANRNQVEMVKLFIDRVDINAKNLAGLTALDIVSDQTLSNSCMLRLLLLRCGALKALSLPDVPTLADSLKKKMSWHEKWIVSDYRKRLNMSNEERNIIVVVAVLFATTNYQALLDGYGEFPQSSTSSYIFSLINNIAFVVSMLQIFLHLPSGRCVDLKLVLVLVISNLLLVRYLYSFHVATAVFFILLFYYTKLPVIIHKFVPAFAYKKSLEHKKTLFKYYSSFRK